MIYEAIEGKVAIQSCPGDKRSCIIGSCMLGDLSKNMTKEFKEYMESHYLSEYI